MASQVNSFAIKLVSSMYLNPEFADVHFTFPNDDQAESVPAHRNILATASPVFSRMFYGPLKEGDIVKIEDSNACAFKKFLKLVYLPEFTLAMENIEEVVRLADKYDMLEVVGESITHLGNQLTVKNVVTAYQLAILLGNSKLEEFCKNRIQSFTKDVLKSEAFLQCGQNMVERILRMDKLECSEIELFDACMKWATLSCQKNELDAKNPQNLKNQLGNCFHLIRFGAMEEKHIGEVLANEVYKGLFTLEEITDFFRAKMDQTFRSVMFDSSKRTIVMKTELNCERNVIIGHCYLRNPESEWFSTNELVQLTHIHWGNIYLHNNSTLYSDVEIIEYDTNTFNKNAPSKVLAIKTNCSIQKRCYISLSPFITINPGMMYEIRVINANGGQYYYYDNYLRATEIKLNDNITIKFHHDPSDNDSVRRNLVSQLTFLSL